MDAIAALPGASFPRVFNKNKDLEGFYRLVENPSVKWRDVLSAHQDRTVERAQELKDVLILHDTTEVRFPLRELAPMRTNLGSLSTATQGFTPQAVPLGTLRIQPFIHKTEAPDEETMAFWNAEGGILDNERERWFTAVEATDAMVASASCSPIHVMDREADSYPMLAWLQGEDYRFVLRACHLNRSVQGSKSPLGAALDDQPFIAEATVPLGSRSPLRKATKEKKAHSARQSRLATLSFRAALSNDNPVRCHVPDRPGLAELRMSRLRSAGVAHLRLANPPTSPRTPDRGSASAIEGANTESDSSRATCRPHSCSR